MVIMLTKTLITKLNNCYIDSSFSNTSTGNTNLINIEVPSTTGNTVRSPFTIRTKDGYALKYDDNAGNVVYRLPLKWVDYQLTEPQVIAEYTNLFTEYTFNLKTLSTYENADPVIDFIPPTYRRNNGNGGYINVPVFEYSDIAEQKENIFIIDTGFKDTSGKSTYIVSYFGKNPNKCKLDLAYEMDTNYLEPGNQPNYVFKTNNGRYFTIYDTNAVAMFGADETGWGGTPITGIVSISANAEKIGEVIVEDNTDGLFTTYVVSQNDLKKIADTGSIYSEIIINTYSYPLKFNEKDLLETDIVIGNTPLQNHKANRFQIAEPKIKIFSFNVPYLKDVESCKLLLPFNTEITLDYDIIRGKTINGYIQYEVSTNSSTLYIDNGDDVFYKDIVVIETVVPFKPTGEYKNFKETEKRLGKQIPTLLIKCLQEETQKYFIKGVIEYPIKGILKEEFDLLNEELQKGVITNE